MILEEKKDAQIPSLSTERDLRLPEEAPPNYEQAVASRLPSEPGASSQSAPLRVPASSPPRINAAAGPSRQRLPPSTSTPTTFANKFWFSLGYPSKSSSEVKTTVQGLISDLVRSAYADESAAILESCAAACRDTGLSLSDLLQQPAIEGHTPLYWAIVKFAGKVGPSDAAPEGARSLVLALLAHSAPLTASTLSEIRAAYAIASDNALYQLCRPYLTPVGGADRMLLTSDGVEDPSLSALDAVVVREEPGTPNAFVAMFEIPLFRKRIRVGGYVSCEFVARGRIFVLSFEIVSQDASRRRKRRAYHGCQPGAWLVTVSLLEHSPPTSFDSRLIIEDQTPPPPNGATKPQLRPPIDLRLKTELRDGLLGPPDMHSHARGIGDAWAKLDDSVVVASLTTDGTPYIAENGTLRGRLEARLTKAEADCIIC